MCIEKIWIYILKLIYESVDQELDMRVSCN